MKVEIVYSNDPNHPLTHPFPKSNGVIFRLVRGDLCDPLNGQWFGPKYPTRVLRHYFKRFAFPYLSWNIYGWRGYVGAKIYGVDAPEYKNWLPPSEVYDGSQAFCITIRVRARS